MKTFVFGDNDLAKILLYYLEQDGTEVEGFVLNKKYIGENTQAMPRPIFAIEDMIEKYGAENCNVYFMVGYKKVNRTRFAALESLKKTGVNICTYIHPSCVVSSTAKIGKGVVLLENVVVEAFVEIGNGNYFGPGTNIGHDTKIGDCNFIASGVVFCGRVKVKDRCFFGANSAVSQDVTIDDECVVGACAFVDRDLPKEVVFLPARSQILEGKTGMDLKFFNT